jgi:exo-beta-1,3-glucanase (GH17 family)
MPSIPFHPPGVTYNGLHNTPNPTVTLVTADLATTKQHFGHVRTYYPQYGGGAVDVGKIAKDTDLALLLGLFLFDGHPDWIAENYEQFVQPAVARGNIAGLLIGNEDPQMMDTVAKYLGQAQRDFPQVPVGTSQTTGFWLSDGRAASLLPLVDFVGANIYPAWDWSRADATTSRWASRPNRASMRSSRPTTSSRRSIPGGRSWLPRPAGPARSDRSRRSKPRSASATRATI